MFRLLRVLQVTVILISLSTSQSTVADACPPQFEDCLKVVGKKPETPECMSFDECAEIPTNLSVACLKSIVGYPNPPVTGEYGEIRDGVIHVGIDYGVPTGTPVYAAKAGIILEIHRNLPIGDRTTLNGNFIRVTHWDGTQGVYLHLENVIVESGDYVNALDQIGTSNDTGRSSGPHLHYQEYQDGKQDRNRTNNPTIAHSACD